MLKLDWLLLRLVCCLVRSMMSLLELEGKEGGISDITVLEIERLDGFGGIEMESTLCEDNFDINTEILRFWFFLVMNANILLVLLSFFAGLLLPFIAMERGQQEIDI